MTSTTIYPSVIAGRVKPSTVEALRELALRQETSVGSLVRRALRELLEREAEREGAEKT